MSDVENTAGPRPVHDRCSAADGPQAPGDDDRSADAIRQDLWAKTYVWALDYVKRQTEATTHADIALQRFDERFNTASRPRKS